MSNKTLKANAKKTKSAHRLLLTGLAAIILAGSALWVYQKFTTEELIPKPSDQAIVLTNQSTKLLCLPWQPAEQQCKIVMDIADSDATRIKGLSGRNNMPALRGMLFISDEVERQCFWMKDMKFAIDMIWLDENKTVTQIKSKVSPDTYPEQFCSPGVDKYVIELNAGTAERLGIEIGRTLAF